MSGEKIAGNAMNWFRGQATGEIELKLQTVRVSGESGFTDLVPPGPDWGVVSVVPTDIHHCVLILWGRRRTVGDILNERDKSKEDER